MKGCVSSCGFLSCSCKWNSTDLEPHKQPSLSPFHFLFQRGTLQQNSGWQHHDTSTANCILQATFQYWSHVECPTSWYVWSICNALPPCVFFQVCSSTLSWWYKNWIFSYPALYLVLYWNAASQYHLAFCGPDPPHSSLNLNLNLLLILSSQFLVSFFIVSTYVLYLKWS